jgi:hypothetical protein
VAGWQGGRVSRWQGVRNAVSAYAALQVCKRQI